MDVFSGHVADVRGVFCHVAEVAGLPGNPQFTGLVESKGQRLVVCEQRPTLALQQVLEMLAASHAGQQSVVKR